jgi:succinyl-CoA synthetase beta subunit
VDEERAEQAKINYIELDGDIGIIGTGAGMAMVNMDQIDHFGGAPANFLDVGPSMDIHGGKVGLDILLERIDLNAIMISGFTGSRLDVLAQDILDSLSEHPRAEIPIVLRLEGRNQEQAVETLSRCTYKNIHFCDDFDQVAKIAVERGKDYAASRGQK